MRERFARVLMTGDTVGGVWTFTMELAAGLSEAGVEVVLATMGGMPSAAQREEAARIPGLCLIPANYKLEWMEEPWDDISGSSEWLLNLAEEYSPDLIHLNSFGHAVLAFAAPVVLTAHSCVASWWSAVHGCEAPPEWDRYRSLVGRALFSADAVTAPSRAMAAALETNYGFPADFCTVIPNGRNMRLLHRAAKEPFVFTAGRLRDQGKNIEALLSASPGLPWPVYAAGDWDGPGALGFLSAQEIANWYARASIYALPAKYEPFGLSVLEAAASGCALVLGDLDSLRENWDGAAVFVPPQDPNAIYRAIDGLISDPGKRGALAERAYHRALCFEARETTRRYLNAYQSALQRTPACAS